MKTRRLGKTELELTELGFGGSAIANLYHPTAPEDAYGAIVTAWESGIRYFDTAPRYGYGLSERRMGDALRQYPRAEYVISTKVGRLLIPDASPKQRDNFPESLPFREQYDYSYDGVMRSFEHSLQRMGTHYIDILYIHDIGKTTHGDAHAAMLKTVLEGGYRALTELREQKVIRAIGLGVNECDVCLEVMPYTDFDCFMLSGHYTLLKQEALLKLFPACAQRNIAIIAASPYDSGILANGQHYNYEVASHQIVRRVSAIQKICDAHQVDLPHAAIQFPLQHPQIVSVVTGARNQEQISLSVNYLQQKVPERLWRALKEAELIDMHAPVCKEQEK